MIYDKDIELIPNDGDKQLNVYFGKEVIYEQNNGELPFGYTHLNYLESTVSQILDTEFISASGVHDFECEFAITENTQGKSLFGARTNTGVSPSPGRIGNLYFNLQNRPSVYIGNTSNIFIPPVENALIVNEKYKLRLEVNQPNATVRRVLNDGVLDNSGSFTGTTKILHSLHLFGAISEGNLQEFIAAKIYSFKIWESGVLVRDFVPALDETNKPCMYCKITKKPYYNARTTGIDFLYG